MSLSWPTEPVRPSLVLFAAILLSFACGFALYRRHFTGLASIPGPYWASFTRLWQVYHIFIGDHNLCSISLHEKHGYFVRIAPEEVSVSHPDGPRIILQALLRKGDWYRIFAVPDFRFKTPQSTLDAKAKIKRSKLFLSGFSLSNLLKSEQYYDANIGQLLNWMDAHAAEHRPMHLDKFFSYTAFDNAGEAVFSQSFGFIAKGEDIDGSIENSRYLNRYLGIAGYFYWLHVLLVANPIMTWLGIMPIGHVFRTSKTALQKRRADPDARFDIIAHWLRTQKQAPDQLSDREIESQATLSVAAGSDTLSCALQSFVYHMIKHPASWRRARAEIREAQAKGHCTDRVISYHDSQELVYVQACLSEAMRMFGPSPFGLARVAPPGGLRIGDQYFPKGTVLSINPQVMQRSKDCWGPDAHEWNPDRWLIGHAGAKYKFFLVYGMGYNRCPGEHLAQLQLSKIAATLVRDYNICQVDPTNEWVCKTFLNCVPHSWPVYIEKQQDTEQR
ncbi:benzoate 4-monooxygenase cytochrome P450 [Polyplosphaeria fusca]|uniref:Benzoate 4-monooxygenase cytochrome P450 n=1 Tax=Polyplosphaeria fusca TaxID=682080 RepID=A0A9P4UX82_9PLEO|nr:benzoate 4-monooxygenase cytochrome P450 [Polyplosphaeria fusca]